MPFLSTFKPISRYSHKIIDPGCHFASKQGPYPVSCSGRRVNKTLSPRVKPYISKHTMPNTRSVLFSALAAGSNDRHRIWLKLIWSAAEILNRKLLEQEVRRFVLSRRHLVYFGWFMVHAESLTRLRIRADLGGLGVSSGEAPSRILSHFQIARRNLRWTFYCLHHIK